MTETMMLILTLWMMLSSADASEEPLDSRACNGAPGDIGYVSYSIKEDTCYRYYGTPVTQSEALARCAQDNATLITMKNPDIVNIMEDLTEGNASSVWIALVSTW